MEIEWQVEDGYCGGRRPQSFNFDLSEVEHCDSVDEAMNIVSDAVTEEFRDKISWAYLNFDQIRAELEKHFEERKRDE